MFSFITKGFLQLSFRVIVHINQFLTNQINLLRKFHNLKKFQGPKVMVEVQRWVRKGCLIKAAFLESFLMNIQIFGNRCLQVLDKFSPVQESYSYHETLEDSHIFFQQQYKQFLSSQVITWSVSFFFSCSRRYTLRYLNLPR